MGLVLFIRFGYALNMTNDKKVFAIIMAAGKGTRIGVTDKPKVMFEVTGRPIIGWVIEPLLELKNKGIINRIITVVGFFGNQIIDCLGQKSEFVWQDKQLGTAHAVRCAENLIGGEEGITIITNGDHALYSADTYQKMLDEFVTRNLTLGFAVVSSSNRFNDYGRVLRDEGGAVSGVIEVPEATEEQKKISERSINLYVVDNKWLFKTLPKIKKSAVKGEYYINQIIEIAVKENKKVDVIKIDNEDEALGINTEEDRTETERILEQRSAGG